MSEVGARGVDEWTGGETEGEVPKVGDGGFDGEAVKFFCKDCRVLEAT